MNNSPPTSTRTAQTPDWRSMRAVADTYSLSYETVRKWVRDDRLPAIRLGRTVRVDANAIRSILDAEGRIA